MKALLSWSSGKDSAWALHALRRLPGVEVIGLATTVNRARGRVSIHAVRVELLRRQAEVAGLPLRLIDLPDPCDNTQYEAAMKAAVGEARREGAECVAFGDLFLRDVREYREAQLAGTGLTALFPLWGLPTDELAREMVGGGLRAVVSCVDPRQLPAGFAGREYDTAFLSELPAGVDPCGERGEFHTFAFGGPMFRRPIDVKVGEIVERGGFAYADILPASGPDVTR
jgi:uncharacterized protein (TIGR00290 family)